MLFRAFWSYWWDERKTSVQLVHLTSSSKGSVFIVDKILISVNAKEPSKWASKTLFLVYKLVLGLLVTVRPRIRCSIAPAFGVLPPGLMLVPLVREILVRNIKFLTVPVSSDPTVREEEALVSEDTCCDLWVQMDVPDENSCPIIFKTVHAGVDIEQRFFWVLRDRHQLLVPWFFLRSLI